jgi:hypothetical protein
MAAAHHTDHYLERYSHNIHELNIHELNIIMRTLVYEPLYTNPCREVYEGFVNLTFFAHART